MVNNDASKRGGTTTPACVNLGTKHKQTAVWRISSNQNTAMDTQGLFGTPFGYMSVRRPFVERFRRECKGLVDSCLSGLKVRFYPKDDQTDAKSAVCGTCYNAKEWRWVAKYLPVDGVFVDIGANMAFNNIEAHLVEAAVGEKEDYRTLIQTNLDYGSGRIGEGEGETVRLRSLLDILADASVQHIDVLKIDIEG